MRVSDPLGGPPNLDQFFREYDEYFQDSKRYEHHLQRLIAGYSRGDSQEDLLREFSFVVQKVVETDQSIVAQGGVTHHVFAHQGRYGELLRDALILLTFGLCLGASRNEIAAILACCDRGDPLLETLAAAAAPDLQMPSAPPRFQRLYDGLYAAIAASGTERERLVREYLGVWYSVKMVGFTFKDTHKIHDRPIYVGYWCFEAAGVVAALDINDETFAGHPHYPKDLVAFYRERRK
jgi:hypothetical protein